MYVCFNHSLSGHLFYAIIKEFLCVLLLFFVESSIVGYFVRIPLSYVLCFPPGVERRVNYLIVIIRQNFMFFLFMN